MTLVKILVVMLFMRLANSLGGEVAKSSFNGLSMGVRRQTHRLCSSGVDAGEEANNEPIEWTRRCETAEDIEAVGEKLSPCLGPGDVLLLRGDLGAGKTCLARGLIREKHQDADMVVTSPSYLLDNTYDLGDTGKKIHHMDLYRLPEGCDMTVLGIPEIFTESLCLIEWPSRMSPDIYPKDYLDVELKILKDESRMIKFIPSIQATSRWTKKLSGLFK